MANSAKFKLITSAWPLRPDLAVRPHLWTKASALDGGSNCTTQSTSGMSTPLAITSIYQKWKIKFREMNSISRVFEILTIVHVYLYIVKGPVWFVWKPRTPCVFFGLFFREWKRFFGLWAAVPDTRKNIQHRHKSRKRQCIFEPFSQNLQVKLVFGMDLQ